MQSRIAACDPAGERSIFFRAEYYEGPEGVAARDRKKNQWATRTALAWQQTDNAKRE